MTHKPTIEHLAIDALIPYARNSRTHSPEQIAQVAASIREFGFTNPVLIDGEGGIIAGHGRVMAARQLGMAEVPCIRLAHLSEAQRRAYVIADNKLALNAGWDEEMLALEFKDLSDMGFDLSLTGFDLGDIDEMLADMDAGSGEGQGDADAAPAPRPEAISKPGDVWVLGKHRVMCGDSTSIDAAGVLMGGGMADLLITDPPYNVAYEGGGGCDENRKSKTRIAHEIENDEKTDADFRQFLRDCYATADACMRPGAAFYIWHADKQGLNFRLAASDVGWTVRQCLIWNKNSLVLGQQDYHSKHEPCLYGWKEGAAHYWGSDRAQTTVLDFNRPQRNGEHPTMKPIDLIQYQVENSSKRGWTVLDLFGGSGSTLIACEKTGRQARLMELDPHYVDVIVRRWQNFTGKQAIHAETGAPFPEAPEA